MDADRRNQARPDRRSLLPRGGRRLTDPPPDHGTRARYKAGCDCVHCRAANTAYQVLRRRRLIHDAATATDWAIEARRRVRQLEIEGYPKSRIAKLAGWKDGRGYHVTFRPKQQIRRTTFERILRVARFAMLEGVDTPEARIKRTWANEGDAEPV